MKQILFTLIAFLSLSLGVVHAQQLSESQLKSVLIYKYIDNITWPDEKAWKTFNLGVVQGDAELETALKMLDGKIVKGNLKIKVKTFASASTVTDVNLIVLPKILQAQIGVLVKQVEGKSDLIISDQCSDQKKVMINFLPPEANRMKFEINKANIINAGLSVKGDALILLGGTEIDVATLYKESQESLESEREKVKKQTEEIQEQRKQIELQSKEISKQKDEMLKQQIAIDEQQKQISQQKTELNNLLKNIDDQQKLLAITKDTLNAQVNRLQIQEASMKEQQKEMDRRNSILSEQEGKIKAQEDKIAQHKATLLKQTATIALQQNLIYVFGAFLLLIISLAFLIYRGYQMKKKANQMLQELNAHIMEQKAEIEAQAEELTAQADALSASNEELERQKEYTTSSIKYGLTIQHAMLPVPKLINKIIPTFIIYRPKDIVSGDFYWFTHVEDKKYIYMAVVDCTGHGVPGAFMSMIGTRLLSAIVNEKDLYEPKDILEELNKGIKAALRQDMNENDDGMDVCLCRFEPAEKKQTKVVYCGAKRPLYYLENGNVKQIKGNLKSVGGRYYDEMEFVQHDLILPKGTRLYLTTDGFSDQNNKKRDRFTNARMVEMFAQTATKSLEVQQIMLEDELDKHQGDARQRDDITLIGVELPDWSEN